jgi:uncharacterized phage-associated protein
MNTVITQNAVKSRGGNMAASEITFSPEKALEAILHIAAKLKIPTIHEVLKVRYFADKLHLSHFGWMASGDDYVAMKFGPVGSGTYNLMKAARGDESGFIHPRFAELVNGSLAVETDRRTLRGLRPADLSRLSRAEVSCLDSAVESYGNMPFDERTELSHDAAWKLAWDAASEDEVGASPMAVTSIAKTLNNASEVLTHICT